LAPKLRSPVPESPFFARSPPQTQALLPPPGRSGICPIRCQSTKIRPRRIAKNQWGQARREMPPLRLRSNRLKINNRSEKGVANRYVNKSIAVRAGAPPSLLGLPLGKVKGLRSIFVIIPIAHAAFANVTVRSTRRLRRGSKETAKHKRPSVSAGPSTSSNSRRPSEPMSKTWPTSRLLIDMLPMSVSCCATRTRC
jgi:hypothetical protein